MEVTQEMLTAAVKEAVKVGLLPNRPVDTDTYLKHWDMIEKILKAAVKEV